ncbi:hypothetical protein [Arenimonas daejeonensis]|uniref:hypothetical protein n=1 Tax=Arenimonas daejeonensis TaxID=370777 RepID=UPI0011BF353E|nr:hypothetical protein [Arenimonas daejeonensis]
MHPLLAAYSLAGGEAPSLGETLGVSTATASSWLRGSEDEVPDKFLARIEAAAAAQVNLRLAELRDEAAGDADPFRKRAWRNCIRDLDRAHWLIYGISLFEFYLRVFLNLARTEADDHGPL